MLGPPNLGERRLKWATLPHGAQLVLRRLPPHRTWRGSGDDLLVGIKDPKNPGLPIEKLADVIRIENWKDTFDRIETIKFNDGSTGYGIPSRYWNENTVIIEKSIALQVSGLLGRVYTDAFIIYPCTPSAVVIESGTGCVLLSVMNTAHSVLSQ